MGAQLRVFRRRIRTVQSTKKITKAMELISASRIVKAQNRLEAHQGGPCGGQPEARPLPGGVAPRPEAQVANAVAQDEGVAAQGRPGQDGVGQPVVLQHRLRHERRIDELQLPAQAFGRGEHPLSGRGAHVDGVDALPQHGGQRDNRGGVGGAPVGRPRWRALPAGAP